MKIKSEEFMKSILYIVSLVFAIIAIGTLSYNYISTEPTTNVITKSSDTNNTGIKVNGEWELTVYNKDGSIEETHEFTNSLITGGKELLVALLTGEYDVDPNTYPITWVINTELEQGSKLKCQDFLDDGSDFIYATITRDSLSFTISSTCTVEVLKGNEDLQVLPMESYIKSVTTRWCFDSCLGNVEYKGITYLSPIKTWINKDVGDFTKKEFSDNQLPVTEGQTIAYNVKISFD